MVSSTSKMEELELNLCIALYAPPTRHLVTDSKDGRGLLCPELHCHASIAAPLDTQDDVSTATLETAALTTPAHAHYGKKMQLHRICVNRTEWKQRKEN